MHSLFTESDACFLMFSHNKGLDRLSIISCVCRAACGTIIDTFNRFHHQTTHQQQEKFSRPSRSRVRTFSHTSASSPTNSPVCFTITRCRVSNLVANRHRRYQKPVAALSPHNRETDAPISQRGAEKLSQAQKWRVFNCFFEEN